MISVTLDKLTFNLSFRNGHKNCTFHSGYLCRAVRTELGAEEALRVSYALPVTFTIVILIITYTVASSRGRRHVGKDGSVGLVLVLALLLASVGSGRGGFIFCPSSWEAGQVHCMLCSCY